MAETGGASTPTPSDPTETVEWGLRRPNGTIAGPLWESEVRGKAWEWGAEVVCRTVTYGDWTPENAETEARGG